MAELYSALYAQSQRKPELRAEFLAHMKLVFRDRFTQYVNGLNRQTGFEICADIPVIPGGPGPKLTPQEYISALTLEDIPPLQVNFQFKERLCRQFREKFLDKGYFESLPRGPVPAELEPLRLEKTPPEIFPFAFYPFVFLVSPSRLGGAPVPRSWRALLDPAYRGKIAINGTKYGPEISILMFVLARYGETGLKALRENISGADHASRLCRYIGTPLAGGCAVSLVPAFFAEAASGRGGTELIWPEEGAVVQPIFLTVRRGALPRLKPAVDYILGEEWGRCLAENRVVSAAAGVENRLGGGLAWAGWDFMLSEDIDEKIALIDRTFGSLPSGRDWACGKGAL